MTKSNSAIVHTTQGKHTTLPLMGSRPQAGFPAPGDDHVERELNIHDFLVTHPASTFFVRIEGDSMIGAGIVEGDILVVDRSMTPQSGSIVVAALFGELVVKRVLLRRDTLELVSENPAYKPIHVVNGEDCFIWGVVVGSARKF